MRKARLIGSTMKIVNRTDSCNLQVVNKLESFNKEVKMHYKRNYYSNVLDGIFFSFGIGFISTTTILPIFVRNLTESKLLISLIMAILTFGGNIPQLISARWAEGLEIKKKPLLFLALLMRMPWLLMAILTYFLTPNYSDYLLVVFFLVLTFYSISSGFTTPVWFDLLTKIIPVEKRGNFFGFRSFFSGLMGVLAAFLAREIIKYYPFPFNFTILFGVAFLGTMISFISLVFIKEPIYPITQKKKSFKEYFKKLPKIVSNKVNFRYFLISIIFIQFFGMANGMFAVAGFDKLNLSTSDANEMAGTFAVLLILSQSLTNLLWGHFSDRNGHKIVLLLAACFNLAGVMLAYFAISRMMFYLVFVFIGIAVGGNSVSFMTIVPEFCLPEEKPTYIAITNTISGLTYSFASLLGGLIADLSGYNLVFSTAFFMMLIGVIILFNKVKEPRLDNNSI